MNNKSLFDDLRLELERGNSMAVGSAFHRVLVDELTSGNPYLNSTEFEMLRKHYPNIMNGSRQLWLRDVYAKRRSYTLECIRNDERAMVLDAGCGFGSDSFLFASLGASVTGIDISDDQIQIAEKRKRYYEEGLSQELVVKFESANLDQYRSDLDNLSLTWFASVLAAVSDQDSLFSWLNQLTRPGGRVVVTDMNLRNPFFSSREWLRRQKAKRRNPEFAASANFGAMFRRTGRVGARYFPRENSDSQKGFVFDDVQFFTPNTCAKLMINSGFRVETVDYSACTPPLPSESLTVAAERTTGAVPGLRSLGYFYTVVGSK